jgi:hypothetical protein
MEQGRSRFLRENAFLAAAVCLPLVVVVFFALASSIPRWMVAPPAYDLLLTANGSYSRADHRVSVEFAVHDDGLDMVITPLPTSGGTTSRRARLLLFDHATMAVGEVTVEIPEAAEHLKEQDPPLTRRVAGFAGRRVLDRVRAPDGYQLENRRSRGGGIVGELFGMNRYGTEMVLISKGRVVPIRMPLAFLEAYYAPTSFVGWVEPAAGGGPR